MPSLDANNNKQGDIMDPAASNFRVIGRGSCGTIFSMPCSEVAHKKGNDTDALWNDFLLSNRMVASMSNAELYLQDAERAKTRNFLRTPRCYKFIGEIRGRDWWATNQSRFAYNPEYVDDNKPSTIFELERILPVPGTLRRRLAQMFMPEEIAEEILKDPTAEACLVRLYFGKLMPTQGPDTLLNFELHLGQMERFGMDNERIEALVSEMALGLAVAHWEAKIDCRDVEFVLGADTHIWILDFDKARSLEYDDIDLMDKLKAGTMGNDPYFPSPVGGSQRERTVWKIFEEAYLETSKAILKYKEVDRRFRKLPEKFIKAWKAQANDNKRAEEAGEDFFE